MRTRRPILTLLLLAGLLAVPATPAAATKSQEMIFEAPRDLLDPLLLVKTFDEMDSLGARSLRVVLGWKAVAPSPDSRIRPSKDLSAPASYDWSAYDPILDEAKSRGVKVQLTISSPVPRWATKGARDNLTRPSPDRFREFVVAVSKHYSSKVARYSIMNEPNLPQFLLPQYDNGKAVSPSIYRGLYDAALRGLRSAGDTKPVLMGETAPNGQSPRSVPPVQFLQGALCLNSKYKRTRACVQPRVDGWAHHPYTKAAGPLKLPPNSRLADIGVLSRMTIALDRAAKAKAIKKGVKLYLTEFGVQSVPDRVYGVSYEKQNAFRAIAEKIAYDNSRVAAISQYLLSDDISKGTGINCCGGFESGLRTFDGKDKPSFDGFRLPLVAERRGSTIRLWGLVRPATATTNVAIERRSGSGAWSQVASPATNNRGVFTATSRNVSNGRWRVVWTAPDGTVFTSPGVPAYTWPSRLR
ncbi:MAG: hypothetical protein V9E83_10125 [Baekduia sp.]